MDVGDRKKIVRLLGVGFDADDGHVRITKGEKHDVLMGSEESHEFIAQWIRRIEMGLAERGLDLCQMTPGELAEFIRTME